MTHVAWQGLLLNTIPKKLQGILMPGLGSLFRMQGVSLRKFTSICRITLCSDGWIRSKRFDLPILQMMKGKPYLVAS